jgi:hypothetical protein
MLLKWAIVILLGYFIYKRFIAIPAPEDNDNQNLTNPDDQHRIQEEDDDYIDFEEIDDKD